MPGSPVGKWIWPLEGDRPDVEIVAAAHRERIPAARTEPQPGPRGALGDVAAGRAELTRRLPVDDEPRALVAPAGDDSRPRKLEQVRLDGREIADRDRDGLEPSAAARIGGLAGDAVDLRRQPHFVHGVEYRRAAAEPF